MSQPGDNIEHMFDQGSPEGGDADVGATLARLADVASPSAGTVATLTSLDPLSLTDTQQVNLVRALERQISWLQACQARGIAAMDCPTGRAPDLGTDVAGRPELVPGPGSSQWVELEVAAALRLAPQSAARRIANARELCGRLPATFAGLSAGRIGFLHALSITDTTQPLTNEQATAVETKVVTKAASQSVGQLRRALGRAVIAAGPAAAQARHEHLVTDRSVGMWALPDGMAKLQMVGPAPQVSAVYTALTALADRPQHAEDTRLAGARRFDSLYEICAHLLAGGEWPEGTPLPTKHGRRPHIQVTVAATTLLGLDQQPAELAGYGPITAEVGRRIAADGTWTRILHDPADGRLLDYGRTTYQPPQDLQDHIIARDQTCSFPHCAQPAIRCDIDHTRPWDQGGTTDPHNCHPACRRHHQAKTIGGWRVHRTPDNSTVWTSPAGRSYTVHPPPYGGDVTPHADTDQARKDTRPPSEDDDPPPWEDALLTNFDDESPAWVYDQQRADVDDP